MELYGKKLNVSADLPRKPLKNDGLFKRLTGHDKITAREIYGSSFKFTSRAKMIFCANELDSIQIANSDTDAVRKRINILHFSGAISDKDRDAKYRTEVYSEARWHYKACSRSLDMVSQK